MNTSNFSFKRNFKLTKKISKNMMILYFSIYFFILILLLIMLLPPLYRSADNHARSTLDMVYDEFTNAMDISYGYTNFFQDEMPPYLKAYENDPSEITRAKLELALSNFVSNQNTLLAASLEDFDHNYFRSSYYRNVVSQEENAKDTNYQHLFELANANYYSYISNEVFRADSLIENGHHILLHRRIQYYNQKPYIVSLYYDLNTVFSHSQNMFREYFSDFAILANDSNVLFSQGDFFTENTESLKDLFDYHLSTDSKNTLTGKYYYRLDPTSGWVFLVFSSYPLLLDDALTIIGIITALYLLSPILYTLLLIPVTNNLIAPLTQLYHAMKNYTPDTPTPLSIHTDDEIEELSIIYNEMQNKIAQQINDIKNKEHINAVTNYKLLATQLDPHFIYNTMNIINIMARQGKNEEIVEVNSALIKILRERLSSKLSILSTMEQELDSLYQYQLIMKHRYENQVELCVDVDDTLLQKKIPKNVLQPLAENAFYHGFANLRKDQEGRIEVLIYSVDNSIVIELSDNGTGIPEERLNIIQNHSYQIYSDNKPHIGLDNIRQRLDYIYHGNYQFQIHSTLGYGTTISITMPLNPDVSE